MCLCVGEKVESAAAWCTRSPFLFPKPRSKHARTLPEHKHKHTHNNPTQSIKSVHAPCRGRPPPRRRPASRRPWPASGCRRPPCLHACVCLYERERERGRGPKRARGHVNKGRKRAKKQTYAHMSPAEVRWPSITPLFTSSWKASCSHFHEISKGLGRVSRQSSTYKHIPPTAIQPTD